MIAVGEFNNKFFLAIDDEEKFSISIKNIAIEMRIGTLKLYHELEKLGGKRKGDTVVFNVKSDAEIALQYVTNTALMNKLSNAKRPSY